MIDTPWAPLTVAEVASLLAGCPSRWWLSGGWAIDHWLGRKTREHGDIDVSTVRAGLVPLLECLPARLTPMAAMSGRLLSLDAARLDDPELHNIWMYAVDVDRFVLQVNVEVGDETLWRYRRDERVTLPWDRAVQSVRGVPTGAAAAQLLWKSAAPRACDEADLTAAAGVLASEERQWLMSAVRAAHPESPWAAVP